MNHPIPRADEAPVTPGAELAERIAEVTHLIAGRPTGTHEQAWAEQVRTAVTDHPDHEVRAHLAASGSLTTVRRLATDPDPYVRWACTFNPFARDADVQDALAADPDERVIWGLLQNVELGAQAYRILAASAHTTVKAILAGRRIRTDLLELYAADREPAVHRPAKRQLAARRALAAARRPELPAPDDREAA